MRSRLFSVCLLAAALAASAAPAFADKDMVQFGSNIVVAPGQTADDTVCFFCSVDDRGTVRGDIVVFFGDVHISGQANHDVVNFFGSVIADDNSSIHEDLVNFFGSVRLGENVTVGQDIVSMFGSFHAAATASNGGDRVTPPAWLFWGPLLVFVLIIYLIVHELRNYRRRRIYLRGYPFPPPPPRP
ncbi:MAG TPA: hypothetical protein VG225_03815 [Terracidiphilus sp.]|jgi:hypothetical protein|nr:hypothetical protein [Terracidiphilus sp.]